MAKKASFLNSQQRTNGDTCELAKTYQFYFVQMEAVQETTVRRRLHDQVEQASRAGYQLRGIAF